MSARDCELNQRASSLSVVDSVGGVSIGYDVTYRELMRHEEVSDSRSLGPVRL